MTVFKWVRVALLLCAGLALSACATSMSGPNATAEDVAKAAYKHPGPADLTLYTMVNNRTGNGAHTSLMINAPSQRIVFDPAGSVRFSAVPEIDDVLYGITPAVEKAYESAHARATYRVVIQRIAVTPEVAERAYRLALASGPVAAAACTTATSKILRSLPGFESVPQSLFPDKLMEAFGQLPGVQERVLRESDSDDKAAAVQEIEAAWKATNN